MAFSSRSVIPNRDAIERLRKGRGWTLEDLAGETGLSMRTVQSALGGNPVDVRTLKVIAEKLEVDYKTLVNGQEQPVAVLVHEETDGSVTVKIHVELIFHAGGEQSPQLQAVRTFLQSVFPKNNGINIAVVGTGATIAIALSAADARAIDAILVSSDLLRFGVKIATAFPPAPFDLEDPESWPDNPALWPEEAFHRLRTMTTTWRSDYRLRELEVRRLSPRLIRKYEATRDSMIRDSHAAWIIEYRKGKRPPEIMPESMTRDGGMIYLNSRMEHLIKAWSKRQMQAEEWLTKKFLGL
jgi:transcriptional regulator with XRE-family HTH domain